MHLFFLLEVKFAIGSFPTVTCCIYSGIGSTHITNYDHNELCCLIPSINHEYH